MNLPSENLPPEAPPTLAPPPPNQKLGIVFMLTKLSIVSLPGVGNLLLAIYISKRLLPEAREDEQLTKKLKLLATFNLILVVMAGALFGVIFFR